jgi:hypothetical protein
MRYTLQRDHLPAAVTTCIFETSLYAIGGKACVRLCNLKQRSQRSAFEALVQACEQLGIELEARTVTKPFST